MLDSRTSTKHIRVRRTHWAPNTLYTVCIFWSDFHFSEVDISGDAQYTQLDLIPQRRTIYWLYHESSAHKPLWWSLIQVPHVYFNSSKAFWNFFWCQMLMWALNINLSAKCQRFTDICKTCQCKKNVPKILLHNYSTCIIDSVLYAKWNYSCKNIFFFTKMYNAWMMQVSGVLQTAVSLADRVCRMRWGVCWWKLSLWGCTCGGWCCTERLSRCPAGRLDQPLSSCTSSLALSCEKSGLFTGRVWGGKQHASLWYCTFGCAVLLCLVVFLTLLASFFLMRWEGRKKEASKVKQTTRQSNMYMEACSTSRVHTWIVHDPRTAVVYA